MGFIPKETEATVIKYTVRIRREHLLWLNETSIGHRPNLCIKTKVHENVPLCGINFISKLKCKAT